MTEEKDWQAVLNEADEAPAVELTETAENEEAAENDFAREAEEAARKDKAPNQSQHADQSIQALKEKIADVEKQANDYKDKLARALSEAENIKRRASIDVTNANKFATKKLLEELLPVVDSLEQALIAENEVEGSMQEGVALTLKMFLAVLEKNAIKVIDPIGEKFDPNLHEAMSMQPASEEQAPDTVLQVFQKGYLLHDRVVRPARVVVAKA